MTATLVTCITTVSAITLSEDFSLNDLLENFKELGNVLDSWLPKNCIVRALFCGATTLVGIKLAPIILRKTSFIRRVEAQSRYFHRTTTLPDLLKIKCNLLRELKDGSSRLPLNDEEKLVLLEINAGGGTNISYYPDGCVYIATDHWEGAKEYLDQNFKEEEEEPRITFDRFLLTIPERLVSVQDSSVSAVICFHSLCSSSNVNLALLEILRVLKPGGKMYFIEHVVTSKKFSSFWFMQLNFSLQMSMWDCHFRDFKTHIQNAGFSQIDMSETMISFKGASIHGPMKSLAPHIYGYAVK
ncbi:hypothetical protein ACHWQZ_G007335 [Mnemiopsis leidyi]